MSEKQDVSKEERKTNKEIAINELEECKKYEGLSEHGVAILNDAIKILKSING